MGSDPRLHCRAENVPLASAAHRWPQALARSRSEN